MILPQSNKCGCFASLHTVIMCHWQETVSPVDNENANERHFILGNICPCNWAAHEKRIRLCEPVCSWWSISLKHTLVCLFMRVCVAPCLWIIKPTSHCNCQQLADWLLSAAICMIALVNRKMKMKECGWKWLWFNLSCFFSICDKRKLSSGLKVKTNRWEQYRTRARLNLCWVHFFTEDSVAKKNLLPAMFEVSHHCYLKRSAAIYY